MTTPSKNLGITTPVILTHALTDPSTGTTRPAIGNVRVIEGTLAIGQYQDGMPCLFHADGREAPIRGVATIGTFRNAPCLHVKARQPDRGWRRIGSYRTLQGAERALERAARALLDAHAE